MFDSMVVAHIIPISPGKFSGAIRGESTTPIRLNAPLSSKSLITILTGIIILKKTLQADHHFETMCRAVDAIFCLFSFMFCWEFCSLQHSFCQKTKLPIVSAKVVQLFPWLLHLLWVCPKPFGNMSIKFSLAFLNILPIVLNWYVVMFCQFLSISILSISSDCFFWPTSCCISTKAQINTMYSFIISVLAECRCNQSCTQKHKGKVASTLHLIFVLRPSLLINKTN